MIDGDNIPLLICLLFFVMLLLPTTEATIFICSYVTKSSPFAIFNIIQKINSEFVVVSF
jgi:hypothetical protein